MPSETKFQPKKVAGLRRFNGYYCEPLKNEITYANAIVRIYFILFMKGKNCIQFPFIPKTIVEITTCLYFKQTFF